jgi:hypothetical protein
MLIAAHSTASTKFRRNAMSLQARLDAFKADFESGKPPYNVPRSVVETMHRATADLVASGAAARALKAGDKAPSFVLNDANGNPVASSALLGQGPPARQLLSRCVVPVLQYGAAGAAGGAAGVSRAWRAARGDLAVKLREQPQVDTQQRA